MKKIVIWGCGIRGNMLLDIIGQEWIECFIDNNDKYKDTDIQGIPIYSYEQYIRKNFNNPIVISPLGKEEEIKKQMNVADRERSFSMEVEIENIREFFYEFGIKNIEKIISQKKKLFVCGDTIFGILVYYYLKKINKKIRYVLSSSVNVERYNNLKAYVDEELDRLVDIDKGACLINTSVLSEEDKSIIKAKDVYLCDIRNISLRKELFYNKDIEKFKNMHKGKRCFIVATGPSLTMEDLDKLKENNEICISVNGIFKSFEKTAWRPDYWVISDPFCTHQWKADIKNIQVDYKFIADYAWNFGEEYDANMIKYHLVREKVEHEVIDFSSDFAKYSYFGGTVTYEGGLQLAAYMGFSEVYLLGVDCNLHKKLEHFVKGYEINKYDEKDQENALRAYRSAELYSKKNGFSIFNATRGGELEVFERVNFDELF